ncbi:uncharacterized protein LOC116804980 [Drosophila grimshawi]|uniref:uncharacterized protein LOC116804980 n=1 Tax=Drosophila grimshawi TaxID=7222 RepID=UPI000C86F8DE|nr:uncharacterized protein LOC116804980 [Drosophila grimshawi]
MSNLIRKILKHSTDFTHWKYLIKNNFNLGNIVGNSGDLKLEELHLERSELEARCTLLLQKQRCVQSMMTDLTRNIKQMEFDIVQMNKLAGTVSTKQRQAEESHNKT